MIGLVAMRILADEPRNVGRRIVGQGRGRVEQCVELLLERRVAAEMIDQAVDVMLLADGRLPAVRLGIVAPFLDDMSHLDRLIVLPTPSVLEAGARESGSGVDEATVILRALAERRGITPCAHDPGQLAHRLTVREA